MTQRQEEFGENDIAIVGMATHFPGAPDVDRYWENLARGVESIRRYSDEELERAGVPRDLLRNPYYVKAGAPLADIDRFDAEFFGFSPKEASILDPQHRHFFECAWEALEDAGHPPEKFDGLVGVFAGCGMGAYFMFNVLTNVELVNSLGLFHLRHTGNDKDFVATRVSYLFNLTGPSLSVQTACSTSLVATHMACQSLLSGECDMALAGGVTIEVPHGRGYLYREGEVLSPDGHCRAFDHRARGTVLGSGAGVVVLRRMKDAVEARDHIYAVIRGSAINNDGSRKAGYLAPSVDGQANAAREALGMADVTADSISYVECHGTGTAIGDPIEIAALTQAFRDTSERTAYCRIGSAKSGIGHLDTAAGVASLAKVALALHHEQIPPTLSFEAPNPSIDFAGSPFVVNTALTDWKRGARPRLAAVNSLGVGGTNAFTILEEAPVRGPSSPAKRPYQFLTVSARNAAALDAGCRRLADQLRAKPELPLADVSYTLLVGRRAFPLRRVLACRDHAEAVRLLTDGDPQRVFTSQAPEGSSTTVFLFPGGGAQYPRMGLELYESEPVYRRHVDEGLALLAEWTDADLRPFLCSRTGEIDASARVLERVSLQLPALFIVEYALAKLWESLGIEPDALIGHSLGENTAACIAGVFSFRDALRLVHLRGVLVEKTAAGGLISVSLTPAELEPLLGPDLELATVNAPALCGVSGPPAALDALALRLDQRGVEWSRPRVPVAAHSRLLDPILPEFRAYLRSIPLRAPSIPFVSNRTGTWITPEQATDPEYWVGHLRHTVLFGKGIDTLLTGSRRILLEVGPGTGLGSLARMSASFGKSHAVLSTLRHPKEEVSDQAYFAAAIGRLGAAGFALDPKAVWAGETRQRVRLPTYAFQRSRYWIEPGLGAALVAEPTTTWPMKVEDEGEWYYTPSWVELPVGAPERGEPSTWLVFLDGGGLGARLVARLRAQGQSVITVRESDGYQAIGADEFTLSPERGRDGYDRLVGELVGSGRTPHRIVHLWSCTGRDSFRAGSSFFHHSQERGFYSLFFLLQALTAEGVAGPVHFTVVSNGMQQVAGEGLPHPEKATLLGPGRVLSRELRGWTCKCVDVPVPARGRRLFGGREQEQQRLEALVAALEAEVLSAPQDAVLAFRDGKRFEQRYPRTPAPRPANGPGLHERGVYVITGGLGGIGLALAEHLARTVHARLVLIGRTAVPAQAEWDEWLRRMGPSDRTSRRIETLRRLESLGAEVLAVAADVTDVEAMEGAFATARQRFGRILGVFHAAGVVDDAPIPAKKQLEVERVLSPKVQGTMLLDGLLERAAPDFLVLFSSTSTVIAPPGQADYVAANAFLDAYAESRANRAGTRVVALKWGIWNEVGLAADALLGRNDPHALESVERTPAEQPLFDTRHQDHEERIVLTARWSASGQWMLDEHRTSEGAALFPGTGYLELARAALLELGESGPFEIRDLLFLQPLFVADEAPKTVRVRLARDEQGYAFAVQSHAEGERGAWSTHAQGRLRLMPLPAAESVPLAEIDRRCTARRKESGARLDQAGRMRFGPRWSSLRTVAFGENEALATVELPASFAAEVADFGLHPAMMDVATGFALSLIEGFAQLDSLWVPLSYGSVIVRRPLQSRVRSWVRRRQRDGASHDVCLFDVVITDEAGNVLVEVADFAVKRLAQGIVAAEAQPAAPLERDAASPSEEARRPSQAEVALRHNLGQGILPAQGAAALERVLAAATGPVIAVSSLELDALLRQVEEFSVQSEEGGAKFERPELGNEYVAPRDDVESTLCGFWEDLLGVERVGVQDSFFDLGGHSLIAVRLFARIQKTYEVDYPISVLFEAPTVEGCAAMIRDSIGSRAVGKTAGPRESRYTHLVAMQVGKDARKPPFYLVAGMFGNVLNLRHLANLIGTDRPFYGLQARGLFGDHEPHESFEAMAEAYLAELRTVQPHGPYFLGGFSGGGITAYEMALELQAAGEEVAMLLMLDSILPQMPAISGADKIRIHGQRLQRAGLGYVGGWARNRIRWELERLRDRLDSGEHVERGSTEFRSEAIEAAFRAALPKYRMRRYPGTVTLFRPKLDLAHPLGGGRFANSKRELVFEDNGWGAWVDGMEIVEVPGDHDSMVLEPNVRVLAARMQACIRRAEEAVRSPARAGVVAAPSLLVP